MRAGCGEAIPNQVGAEHPPEDDESEAAEEEEEHAESAARQYIFQAKSVVPVLWYYMVIEFMSPKVVTLSRQSKLYLKTRSPMLQKLWDR